MNNIKLFSLKHRKKISKPVNHVASSKVVSPTSNRDILMEPYSYLLSNPGKDIRTKLIEAFDFWLKVPKDQLTIIKKVIEMLHNASLLIDDVQDNSTLRRGVPVAHQIFGIPTTINCANYVYFLALDQLSRLNNPKMLHIFTEELLNLHRGQGMELYWRDNFICPSEEEFIEMVSNKTGGLLRLAVKLMQEAINIIGIHFQIRDDYMNMQSEKYSENKGFCEDLTEGKFSFPIIHSIQTDNSNRRLINILKQRTNSLDLKMFAMKIIDETGSFAYTRRYLTKTEQTARDEIKKLDGNPYLEKIIEMLHVDDNSQ
nr:522_t:CDS:2 [Entrophospora candida]